MNYQGEGLDNCFGLLKIELHLREGKFSPLSWFRNAKILCFSVHVSGKATIITIGGLVAGAVVGSAVESWLQVDIVPFLGINSPAAVISEFILFSQFLVSLCLR